MECMWLKTDKWPRKTARMNVVLRLSSIWCSARRDDQIRFAPMSSFGQADSNPCCKMLYLSLPSWALGGYGNSGMRTTNCLWLKFLLLHQCIQCNTVWSNRWLPYRDNRHSWQLYSAASLKYSAADTMAEWLDYWQQTTYSIVVTMLETWGTLPRFLLFQWLKR